MNKPEILSKKRMRELGLDEDWKYGIEDWMKDVLEAQRDADVAYYEPLIQQAKFDGYELALEKLDIAFGKGYEQAKAEAWTNLFD